MFIVIRIDYALLQVHIVSRERSKQSRKMSKAMEVPIQIMFYHELFIDCQLIVHKKQL